VNEPLDPSSISTPREMMKKNVASSPELLLLHPSRQALSSMCPKGKTFHSVWWMWRWPSWWGIVRWLALLWWTCKCLWKLAKFFVHEIKKCGGFDPWARRDVAHSDSGGNKPLVYNEAQEWSIIIPSIWIEVPDLCTRAYTIPQMPEASHHIVSWDWLSKEVWIRANLGSERFDTRLRHEGEGHHIVFWD
jgi:hypothetical protein